MSRGSESSSTTGDAAVAGESAETRRVVPHTDCRPVTVTSRAATGVRERDRVRQTITEFDVYSFAGITGDFSRCTSMRSTRPNILLASGSHGVLLMGLISTTAGGAMKESIDGSPYGYDNVRFIRPVRFGGTITVSSGKVGQSGAGREITCLVEGPQAARRDCRGSPSTSSGRTLERSSCTSRRTVLDHRSYGED